MNSRVKTLCLLLLAGTIAIETGCKDSNSISGLHGTPAITSTPPVTPTITPTPPPAGNIAGDWIGTFDSADFVDCDSNTPAQASFDQNGSTVTGTLNATMNACGFSNVKFQGTLEGTTLRGTIAAGNRFTNGTVFGSLSGSSLELGIGNGFGRIPGGRMHLHR